MNTDIQSVWMVSDEVIVPRDLGYEDYIDYLRGLSASQLLSLIRDKIWGVGFISFGRDSLFSKEGVSTKIEITFTLGQKEIVVKDKLMFDFFIKDILTSINNGEKVGVQFNVFTKINNTDLVTPRLNMQEVGYWVQKNSDVSEDLMLSWESGQLVDGLFEYDFHLGGNIPRDYTSYNINFDLCEENPFFDFVSIPYRNGEAQEGKGLPVEDLNTMPGSLVKVFQNNPGIPGGHPEYIPPDTQI